MLLTSGNLVADSLEVCIAVALSDWVPVCGTPVVDGQKACPLCKARHSGLVKPALKHGDVAVWVHTPKSTTALVAIKAV